MQFPSNFHIPIFLCKSKKSTTLITDIGGAAIGHGIIDQNTVMLSVGTILHIQRRNWLPSMRADFGQCKFAYFFAAFARRYLYDFKNDIFEILAFQGLKWYIICLCPFKFNLLISIIWGDYRPLTIYCERCDIDKAY